MFGFFSKRRRAKKLSGAIQVAIQYVGASMALVPAVDQMNDAQRLTFYCWAAGVSDACVQMAGLGEEEALIALSVVFLNVLQAPPEEIGEVLHTVIELQQEEKAYLIQTIGGRSIIQFVHDGDASAFTQLSDLLDTVKKYGNIEDIDNLDPQPA